MKEKKIKAKIIVEENIQKISKIFFLPSREERLKGVILDQPMNKIKASKKNFDLLKKGLVESINKLAEIEDDPLNRQLLLNHIKVIQNHKFFNEFTRKLDEDKSLVEEIKKYLTGKLDKYIENHYQPEFRANTKETLEDILSKLLLQLTQRSLNLKTITKEKNITLLTKTIDPTQALSLDQDKVDCVLTQQFISPTSHVAIITLTKGIKIFHSLSDRDFQLLKNHHLSTVLIDMKKGIIILNPDKKKSSLFFTPEKKNDRNGTFDSPDEIAISADKRSKIKISININNESDFKFIKERKWPIGLFRTEFLYLNNKTLPGIDEQRKIYSELLEINQGKEVVIRTIDIGGDKELSTIKLPKEKNPFLGYRGIRWNLTGTKEQQKIFTDQLIALITSKPISNLKIMFPMVTTNEELERINYLLKKIAKENSINYNSIRKGIMIEVPAAALNSASLARQTDFFSLGTNDLLQYTFATDRNTSNPQVYKLFQEFSPAFWKLIYFCINNSPKNFEISLCGDIASNPLALPLIIGAEIKRISIRYGKIETCFKTISKLDSRECRNFFRRFILEETDPTRTTEKFIKEAIKKQFFSKEKGLDEF